MTTIEKSGNMDYKEKYEAALRLARSYYDENTNQFLDTIFPELRESEDERMRKEILNFIKVSQEVKSLTTKEYSKWIAWLVKQKEPENTSASTMIPSCWAEEPSLQKEQKPAGWSEEDETTRNNMIKVLDGYIQISGDTRREFSNWLKSLRPQYNGDVTMTEAYKMGLEAGKASSWKPSEEQMICPKCGEKMILDEGKVYTSIPPKYGYKCHKCGNYEYSTKKL